MKKILVTGGTGFIGSYLLRYLVRDSQNQVRAIKRPNSPMGLVKDIQDKIEWVDCDILDVVGLEDAMRDVQQVYHTAAMVSFEPKHRKALHQINVEGTANVVNIALEASIEKMVYMSSVAAFGRRKNLKWIDENTKWEPSNYNSQYGISKYLAEQEVWRGIAEGLNVGIINPSVVVGSGFWDRGSARFFSKLYEGTPVYPLGSSGFVDVRDVARLMIKIMESEISSERFLANGENSSYKDFFFAVAKSIDKKPPSIRLTPLLGGIAWRAEWLRAKVMRAPTLITRETVENSSRSFFYKNQKSMDTFDFEYTPIQQTIYETGKQFLEAVQEGLPPKSLPLI